MKRVLIPIDFSENSMLALKHGIAIANKLQANLRIIHVKTGAHYAPEFARQEVEVRLNDRIDAWLDWIFQKYGPSYTVPRGIFDYKIREGSVVQQIANQALYDDTTMIVVGSHGVSGFSDRWIGSNAYRLAVNAPCPVLVLRPDMTFDPSFSHIVIPVNLKKSSRKKLPVVAGVAKLFHAKVNLVGLRQSHIKFIFIQLLVAMGQVQNYLSRKAGVQVESTTTLTGGNLPQKLIQYSMDVKADMIAMEVVVNANPLTDFFRPFLNDLINQAKCPILTIPLKE